MDGIAEIVIDPRRSPEMIAAARLAKRTVGDIGPVAFGTVRLMATVARATLAARRTATP